LPVNSQPFPQFLQGLSPLFSLFGIDTTSSTLQHDYLDILLAKFPEGLPSTKDFSQFSRDTLPDLSALDDPDITLVKWMEREEILFRTYEEYLIQGYLKKGFDNVDSFMSFSLSVHNRRKSRAGHAFENHIEAVFLEHKIPFSRNKKTEFKSKPDFIFPSIQAYQDSGFPDVSLKMLAVKTTCKDRWRQILSEARRIDQKHLATLEPGISVDQTSAMISSNVQLVVPTPLHNTYHPSQIQHIMAFSGFLSILPAIQNG